MSSFIKASPMRARHVSQVLRKGESDHLRRRRAIAGLSLAAAGAMAVVGLYQFGIIRRIPEPHIAGLDAERVDAAPEAYQTLSSPDAFVGLVSYATTALLSAADDPGRARKRPWLPLALAAKVAADAVVAAKLTYDQFAHHKAACSWCLLASAATFASLPLALPEAKQALSRLLGRE
jgi:uncharacterized membrane protein